MNREQANAVYDLLVRELDAMEHMRENFIYVMTEGDCREYRFMGCLGFGGKLYVEARGKLRVGCYREDETPELRAKMAAVNELLKTMAPTGDT